MPFSIYPNLEMKLIHLWHQGFVCAAFFFEVNWYMKHSRIPPGLALSNISPMVSEVLTEVSSQKIKCSKSLQELWWVKLLSYISLPAWIEDCDECIVLRFLFWLFLENGFLKSPNTISSFTLYLLKLAHHQEKILLDSQFIANGCALCL